MNSYVYVDHNTGKTVFECKADNILDADDLLFKATGIWPLKATNIGCSITFGEKHDGCKQTPPQADAQ